MKKGIKIALIILALIIIIGIIVFFVIKNSNEGKKYYEIAQIENYNYFLLKESDKYGVIDKTGNIIIQPKYTEVCIPNPEKDVFVCYDDNTSIILNGKGDEIYSGYQQIESIRLKNVISDLMYEKTVLTYSKDNKMGLIGLDGNKITDAIYESIESLPCKEGQLLIKNQGKIGVMNIKGYQMIPCKYDKIEIDEYYEEGNSYKYSGYITTSTTDQGYRLGYVDYDGNEIVEPIYNDLERVKEIKNKDQIYLILAQNGKYGVFKDGEEFIKNDYQSIRYEDDNKIFVVEKSKKYGVINIDGQEILPMEFDQIDITGIYIYAEKDGETKVYDNEGKIVNMDEKTSILTTENEKYKIKLTSNGAQLQYGVIDSSGKEIVPQEYSYIEFLYDNYFIASDAKGNLGVIDSDNNIKLELKYNSLQKSQNTKIIQAGITKTKVSEFYSSDMNKICELTNAKVEKKNNYLIVSGDEEIKYINSDTQKEVSNKEVYNENTLFAYNDGGKWGFVDKNDKKVVECKYDKVTEFNKYGFAGIKSNDKWGVVNQNGEIIVEPSYKIENEANLNFIGPYYSVEYGFGEIYYTK